WSPVARYRHQNPHAPPATSDSTGKITKCGWSTEPRLTSTMGAGGRAACTPHHHLSLREVQDLDGAAAFVGYVGLASVGQLVDARGLYAGLDRADDLVARGVDHRDRVVVAVRVV